MVIPWRLGEDAVEMRRLARELIENSNRRTYRLVPGPETPKQRPLLVVVIVHPTADIERHGYRGDHERIFNIMHMFDIGSSLHRSAP